MIHALPAIRTTVPLCARKKITLFRSEMGSIQQHFTSSAALFEVSCKYLQPFNSFLSFLSQNNPTNPVVNRISARTAGPVAGNRCIDRNGIQ